MTLRKGKTYRHMSCLDVDMHVLAISYVADTYFVIKPVWVNRDHGYLFSDSAKRLYFKDLWKWKEV